jgi:protein-disulfide isomerase
VKKIFLLGACLVLIILIGQGFAQEDQIIKIAIQTARIHMRIPNEIEVKFIEKKKSPLPDFYSVKLSVLTADREIPIVIYVDETGDKVILGALIIKGENVSQKEAGEPISRKIDMSQLEIEKSPYRGNPNAKVMIVEFSNFRCSYCQLSWAKMEKVLERYSQNIRYVFKHFPLQSLQGSYELSEIAASAQEISNEAFWTVHDFFFSPDGQMILKEDMGAIKKKIEQVLAVKGFDVKAYQMALEKGLGKKKVTEDITIGKKIPVMGTPSIIVNGNLIKEEINDQFLEKYLTK